jgi:hypothetical protein
MNICKMFNIHWYNLNELLKKVMEYIYDVYKFFKKKLYPRMWRRFCIEVGVTHKDVTFNNL